MSATATITAVALPIHTPTMATSTCAGGSMPPMSSSANITANPSTPKMLSSSSPHDPITPLPRRPDPSRDPFLATPLRSPRPLGSGLGSLAADVVDDLFSLEPIEAMRLLCAGVENLVALTGDVPPTPPSKVANLPNMRRMLEEKATLVRTHSEKNLSRLRIDDGTGAQQAISTTPITADAPPSPPPAPAPPSDAQPPPQPAATPTPTTATSTTFKNAPIAQEAEAVDGVRLRHPPPSQHSPPATQPYEVIIGSDQQPLNLQHSAITRKFYCKKAPPVTMAAYLERMHRFCPMSTAVYLAASLYIHRLAVEERSIPVTARNAHRLVLAALRVAAKVHDDRLFSHVLMSRVGGVSPAELAKLEVSFCFLTSFDLAVSAETLRRHWAALRRMRDTRVGGRAEDLPPLQIKRREKATPQ
jgi:hypothetical protein